MPRKATGIKICCKGSSDQPAASSRAQHTSRQPLPLFLSRSLDTPWIGGHGTRARRQEDLCYAAATETKSQRVLKKKASPLCWWPPQRRLCHGDVLLFIHRPHGVADQRSIRRSAAPPTDKQHPTQPSAITRCCSLTRPPRARDGAPSRAEEPESRAERS